MAADRESPHFSGVMTPLGEGGETGEDPSLAAQLRAALRLAPAAVTIVTSGRGASALGMTATSVTPVTLEPPALLVCVNHALRLNAAIRASEAFRISYLRRDQEEIARAFGGAETNGRRFTVGGWDLEAPDGPALPGALADIACRLDKAFDYGTHSVFIGCVRTVRRGTGEPLLYCDGGYAGLQTTSLQSND